MRFKLRFKIVRFLLLLSLGNHLGCSEKSSVAEVEHPSEVQVMKTSSKTDPSKTSQIISRGGSKYCEITSDGEVWIDGDKKGSIEPNGEIWVAGDKEGSLEKDGEVWKAGNKIGDITSDLEIWYEGDNVGEIESDGTIWRNGDSIGSTKGGDARRAAIVLFFGFF